VSDDGPISTRAATAADRSWVESFLADNSSSRVARRGELVRPIEHTMLIAERGGGLVGLLTYELGDDRVCEILSLHATEPWKGVGTALLDSVAALATTAGCRTLWLVTTNDNVDALRFYQRRGFRLRAIRPGAVDDARRALKPEIPEVGEHGIAIRDEIELERAIEAAP
jgi:N-acetylglutamate synthase-like GNAT family acetyltransferase